MSNTFNFNFWDCWHKPPHPPHHPPRPVKGRFPGVSIVTPKGEIPVAQTVPANTALTGPLLFVDQHGGPIAGPIGTISADNAAANPTLSADGQSFNFTSLPVGAVTLTWHDPTNVVPDFQGVFTDEVLVPTTGSFGTAVPGTTP